MLSHLFHFNSTKSASSGQVRGFSLRTWLWLGFAVPLCLALLFGVPGWKALTDSGSSSLALAERSQRLSLKTHQLMTIVADLEQQPQGRIRELSDRFRETVREHLSEWDGASESERRQVIEASSRLSAAFEGYLSSVPSAPHEQLPALLRQIGDMAALDQKLTVGSLKSAQSSLQRVAGITLSFIGVFELLVVGAALWLVVRITHPLQALIRFMGATEEGDGNMPLRVPGFRATIREFSQLLQGFERLLGRLRIYRALNVPRLLAEKRRADIVAASITDGMFLLRGDEILYMNPVACQILNVPADGPQLNLGVLCNQGIASAGVTGNNNETAEVSVRKSVARSILNAISQTIPVELAIEQGDRKLFYLVQSYPISDDLIEMVEHQLDGEDAPAMERFQATTLVVAQDMTLVRESQEAKSHFLGTLSHEIKTPVTSLTMATRLLQKFINDIPNPMHRNLIMTCVEDVDRLRKLLEDLLTISRFETLTQRLALQTVDFVKLLKHAVQSFQVQANERGVTLTFSTLNCDRTAFVPMDPTKISWAVSNLVTNALRHTPRGGRVEARLEREEEQLVVRIRDTGPGIERKRQNRIFDKFSSHYDIRVARSGGAGTGLSIAREIVAAHGGRIWVSSEPGQGAEFCFSLPLKSKSADAGTQAGDSVISSAKGVTSSGASSRG